MAQPAPVYDLTLLLAPNLEDDVKNKVLSDTESAITSSGELVSKHDWGLRKTEYEVKKKPEAEYHLLQFRGSAELIAQLDRTLRITDAVVRHRIIKLKPGTPDVPDLKAQAAAAPVEGEGASAVERESVPAER